MSKQLRRFAFTKWFTDEDYTRTLEETGKFYANMLAEFPNVKKWVFQIEQGEDSGKHHLQGRVSFAQAVRIDEPESKAIPGWHLSIEHNEERSAFYCTKKKTRICGPWSDKDAEDVLPDEVLEELHSEIGTKGETLIELVQEQTRRNFHFVVDPVGNNGKTTWANEIRARGIGRKIPILDSVKDMIQFCIDKVRPNEIVVLDIPRSLVRTRTDWLRVGTLIEMIKDGYFYDSRYHGRDKYIFGLKCVVFCNVEPQWEVSADRPIRVELRDYFGAAL